MNRYPPFAQQNQTERSYCFDKTQKQHPQMKKRNRFDTQKQCIPLDQTSPDEPLPIHSGPAVAKRRRQDIRDPKDLTESILKDLISFQKKFSDSNTSLSSVLSCRKAFWKRQLSEVSSNPFEALWNEVKLRFVEWSRNNSKESTQALHVIDLLNDHDNDADDDTCTQPTLTTKPTDAIIESDTTNDEDHDLGRLFQGHANVQNKGRVADAMGKIDCDEPS